MDWLTVAVASATGALATVCERRLARARDVEIRKGDLETEVAVLASTLARAEHDVSELAQRMAAAECQIAALKARLEVTE